MYIARWILAYLISFCIDDFKFQSIFDTINHGDFAQLSVKAGIKWPKQCLNVFDWNCHSFCKWRWKHINIKQLVEKGTRFVTCTQCNVSPFLKNNTKIKDSDFVNVLEYVNIFGFFPFYSHLLSSKCHLI